MLAGAAERLAELDALWARLDREVSAPAPWIGNLRRLAQASAVESSVSIEGFSVAPGEALEIVAGAETLPLDDEGRSAVAAYAHAMDHVEVLALDPAFRWLDRVILDLHFDACAFQRDKSPGRWRSGPIRVTAPDGGTAYEGPDADEVVALMAEVIDWLDAADPGIHVAVLAAMAHLHLVSVHPFRDGNGRVARIVQALVLARGGLLSPEFSSIEDYIAAHSADYYAVLRQVQGGRYRPDGDASKWVDFCLDAHIAQARRRLEQVADAATRWAALERIALMNSWPDRLVIALEQSLVGGTDRSLYVREAGVSAPTASNDLRRLRDAGLVVQIGRGRSVRYHASDDLRARIG